MPYDEKLELSELSSAVLPNLRDFISEILNLSELYGYKVRIPVAYPPKIERGVSSIAGTASIYGLSSTMGVIDDRIQGKFQDDAILKESADKRLNRVVLIKKLGGISNVEIDNSPLERREMSIYIEKNELISLLNKIEERLKDEQKKESEKELKRNNVYYDEETSTLMKGEVSVELSELENVIAVLLFNPKDAREEVEAVDVIQELTGDIYQKSENQREMERIRQAVYRLNEKIYKTFKLKNHIKFSQRTHKITKNTNI